MPTVYEIYADEAWTHGGEPPNRYWCFYGGILGEQSASDRLDTEIRDILRNRNVRGEVKWSKLSAQNIDCYKELIDCLFRHIRSGNIKYRQMFLDRSYVPLPRREGEDDSDLTIQFKLYYQFLKHSFGLQHLPVSATREPIDLLIRLDSHSSQGHKDSLESFALQIPRLVERSDLRIQLTFHNSARIPRMQICDLLMGAAGSHGNKMQLRREGGRRGMSSKQKLRVDLCGHIYNGLRQIDHETRGSNAFNWFESTGLGDSPANAFNHPVQIWKFKPHRHRRDAGWFNSNLDRYGNYVGPIIQDP